MSRISVFLSLLQFLLLLFIMSLWKAMGDMTEQEFGDHLLNL